MSGEYFILKVGEASFEISPSETILECTYKNGVKIAYQCASGHCGRCKVRLVEGRVRLEHAGGISRRNIAKGFILACCTFPKSDVEIQ